ncbi:hypothetical protein AMAG_12796 [Allomyces macrogynus ATCC 38327]|uniref:Uncharacterized protein n=1 Tax=Allomyces macrogynus (strain ATCC 38327) TaxID=578462 RepID=A0A0L0T1X9_ALLM3|nr:hypothetical protein AMAG_12796 [Allomyces macrogynus ATCC 38327]|eukprot:KNE68630.1 hypothetical protein AMAG_12796 [Allomyces macrogynus ATCC 38327]
MSPLTSPLTGFSRRAASFFRKARPLHPKQVDDSASPTSTKVAPHTYSPDSETTVVGSGSVAAIRKSTLTVALTDRVATVQRKSAHPWSTSVSLSDGMSEIAWTRLPPLVARAQLGPVVGEVMFPTAEKKYAKYRKRQAAATGSKRWSGAVESVGGKMEAKLMMHKDEGAFCARMPFPLESLELLLNLLLYITTPATPTQSNPNTFPPRGIVPTPQHITITRDLVSCARNHRTTGDIATTLHTAFHHGFPEPTTSSTNLTDLVLATILATLRSALKKFHLFADTPAASLFALADLIPAPNSALQPGWLWPAILATCPLSIRIAVVQVMSVAGVLATRFPESSVIQALVAPMFAKRHSADAAVVDRVARWMVRANRAWMRHVAEDATATYARERLDVVWAETALGGTAAVAAVEAPQPTTMSVKVPVKVVEAAVPIIDVTPAAPEVLARDRASLERACNITDLRLVRDGSADTSDLRGTIECTSVLPSMISMNRPVGEGVPVGGATDGKRLADWKSAAAERAQTLPVRRAGGD